MPASPSAHIAAIESLPRQLAQADTERLAAWLALMDEAGRVMNLTGLHGPQEMALELVGEALRLQDIAAIPQGSDLLDIGSGNGSPVIPLAVLNPESWFTAVEARQRRADFLKFVAARLKLKNLEVVCARVEQLPADQQGPYELVVSRAFAAPASFISIAAGLLAETGEVRGMGGEGAAAAVGQAAALHGLQVAGLEVYMHLERERCVYRLVR